jgi:hypothetical protein
MSKLSRVLVLAIVVSASGCITFQSDPTPPGARPGPAQRRLFTTHVVEGRAPAGLERAIRDSATVGATGSSTTAFTTSSSVAWADSSSVAALASDDAVAGVTTAARALTLHVAYEDAVDAPPVLAFFAGLTAFTIPVVLHHELVVRGWVADGDARLCEAEARRKVTVAWTWLGLFTPWLWEGAEGERAIEANVHAMTLAVIEDLVAQHDLLPPSALEVTPATETPEPAPWDAPEPAPIEPAPLEPAPLEPAPWDAPPDALEPAPWDAAPDADAPE